MRRLSLDESLMFSGISTKFQHMTNGYFRILMPLILCPTTLRKVLLSLFLVRRGYSTAAASHSKGRQFEVVDELQYPRIIAHLHRLITTELASTENQAR